MWIVVMVAHLYEFTKNHLTLYLQGVSLTPVKLCKKERIKEKLSVLLYFENQRALFSVT